MKCSEAFSRQNKWNGQSTSPVKRLRFRETENPWRPLSACPHFRGMFSPKFPRKAAGWSPKYQEIGSAQGAGEREKKFWNKNRPIGAVGRISSPKEGDRRPCSCHYHCCQPRIKLSSAHAKNGTRQAKWRLEPVSRPCAPLL